MAIPYDPRARRFVLSVLLAFLPAAVIGALAHDFIKTRAVRDADADRRHADRRRRRAADRRSHAARRALRQRDGFSARRSPSRSGFCQCLAMIPGVSRSGATIVGAMLLGTDKRSAAEFSFFLAMPTMAGAFTYDLYKNWSILQTGDIANIALGLRHRLHRRGVRRALPARLRQPPRLCGVRLVAHHRRRRSRWAPCWCSGRQRAARSSPDRRRVFDFRRRARAPAA